MPRRLYNLVLAAAFLVGPGFIGSTQAQPSRLRVVASVPNLASIASAVAGDRIEVTSLAVGIQDARYVVPKSSYVVRLHRADLLFLNGLDLEAGWIPELTQSARNPKIVLGGRGYVDCAAGVRVIEVPRYVSRAFGEIHPYGDPFYLTDPLNAEIVAETIAEALKGADPDSAQLYENGRKAFVAKLREALFGKDLVGLVGGDRLAGEASAGTLDAFLDRTAIGGVMLRSRLGGWLGKMQAVKGKPIVTYHKDYTYFANRFGLRLVDSVEAKQGIQPSRKRLRELAERLEHGEKGVIVTRPFLEHRSTDFLAQQTNFKVISLPLEVGGVPEAADYFELFDYLTDRILAVFANPAPGD